MTKRQLIDRIIARNQTAAPSFLAEFEDQDLQDYLDHLCLAQQPRLEGNSHRYDKYFQITAAVAESSSVAVMDPPDYSDSYDNFNNEPYHQVIAAEPYEDTSQTDYDEQDDPLENTDIIDEPLIIENTNDTSFAKVEEDNESWLF